MSTTTTVPVEQAFHHLAPIDTFAETLIDNGATEKLADWFADRYHAALLTRTGNVLAACYLDDELRLVLLTAHGSVIDRQAFSAPDGDLYPPALAAFNAVLAVWLQL